MKLLLGTIVAFLMSLSPCTFANGFTLNTSTAGELYTVCKTDVKSVVEDPYADPESTISLTSCFKYLEGFVEGHEAVVGRHMSHRSDNPNVNKENIRIFCLPAGETKGKIMQKVLFFFEKNKENLALMNSKTPSALAFALKIQYPCK